MRILMPLLLLATAFARGAAPRLEPVTTPSRMCALHRPAGWKVAEAAGPGSFALSVTAPDAPSRVELAWARGGGKALDALRRVREGRTGARLADVFVSADGARAVATLTYREGGAACAGRIFAETGGGRTFVQWYGAPEAQLAAQRPFLMNVMMSVTFIKAPRGGPADSPLRYTLVDRRAPDGSMAMKVPGDWTFLAAKGTVVTGAPGGGAGFIFTSFSGNPMVRASVLQGVIARAYEPPARTLPIVLLGFGHHDPKILSDTPDAGAAAQYRAQLRRACQASDLVATWTSRGGVDCLGAFKVINGLPGGVGIWSSLVMGIWGPRKDFGRHLPLLEDVAASYSMNDAFARRYIQDGLARLRRMEADTARAVQSLNYARADMQKAWEDRQARKDYMDSRWDDYRRGNSYWVSDLEGGKVYQADSHGTRDTLTGDYYEGGGYTYTHFEGRNPRHASETMREVSSYEVEHGAPPR